ncbi:MULTISPECIES: DUF4625 domain-containing protein [Bacteroides]|uniref:DUF4625 domain-containing protein n=1 Tax=Bacteroides TaxID=816 RepID=UPI00259CB497|nr:MULTISPECIES: DUF4625 domain-containing protein [Bacteroides]
MKTKIYFTAILVISVLAFFSCDKEDSDTTKPVIDLHEPAEGQALLIGSKKGVHFEMDLSDNIMLKSYKIDIHNNFDHHSHGRTRAEGGIPFVFNRSYDVSNKKNVHIHHHDIVIPADATPGDYHLMVYCTDAAGNETYIARNIVLSTTADEDHDE